MRKRNYQKETESILEGLGGSVPTLLLHVCCAPCSSYVLEYLSAYFEITVYYYDPNIEPEEEYRTRRDEVKRLISELRPQHPVTFTEGPYDPERFHEAVKGLEREKEGGKRCEKCFELRLGEAAKAAEKGRFDFLTTTLTISPLKNAEMLNETGEKAVFGTGVRWLPSDFKKRGGYQRSIELSREHGLYRQDYCGCVYSRLAREEEKRAHEERN